MSDNKKAAKAFVDKYFPVKQPSTKSPDVLSDLFPPKTQQGHEGNSSSISAATDGRSHAKAGKSRGSPQKSGNAVVFSEASEAWSMSSSVDYGCRDNYYPNSSANRHEKKDKKDGQDYPDPENSRGEWWQGSLYY